ncbi:MAG: SsrA-binding protein SmpB [Gammaproteobacteria bacterium]|nr:SsrA-binding protein SmpB [Gammaproteobacteria bacterium]
MPKSDAQSSTIARNRRARFNFSLEKTFQAGLVLEGWELKSIRAGKVQLVDTYVIVRENEAYLLGARINPLPSTSTHSVPQPDRTRKLLLNRRELREIATALQIKGKSCVATSMYWRDQYVKCEIAIATGKRAYDKRKTIQEREWNRQKERLRKQSI